MQSQEQDLIASLEHRMKSRPKKEQDLIASNPLYGAYHHHRQLYLAKRAELRKKYKEDLKPFKKSVLEKSKIFFKHEAKIMFECHPTMESFSWLQYTPYFNDGDECYFDVHYDEVKINGKNIDLRRYNSALKTYIEDKTPLGLAKADVVKFLKSFNNHEQLFGDHVEVKVDRDKVVVQHYEHDEG